MTNKGWPWGDARYRPERKLRRHQELESRIGDALSRGVLTSWSRERTAHGWRWTLETPEGPCCLTFRRCTVDTKTAEEVLERLIECHRKSAPKVEGRTGG